MSAFKSGLEPDTIRQEWEKLGTSIIGKQFKSKPAPIMHNPCSLCGAEWDAQKKTYMGCTGMCF